jgi:hypothetical protein
VNGGRRGRFRILPGFGKKRGNLPSIGKFPGGPFPEFAKVWQKMPVFANAWQNGKTRGG